MSSPRRIFLSAVAEEFPAEIEGLRAALAELDCQMIDLSGCPTYWRTVDKRARDLIASCDLVIHIAGARCGRVPDAATVPSGKPRRSIAQMEHDIATELQSNLHVFLSADDRPESQGLKPESDELSQLQQQHRESLQAAGLARALPDDSAEWAAVLGSLMAAPTEAKAPVIHVAKSVGKSQSSKPETVAGMPLPAVAIIIIGLIVVGLGALKLAVGRSDQPAEQTVAALDVNTVRRVLQAYIANFRDWQRDTLDVPNLYLDHWVRSTLPTSLPMSSAEVTRNLEQALSRDWEAKLTMEDRLAAQVAARRYQSAIDLGLAYEETLTAEGLEIAGIAALAKHGESQLNSHVDRAVKFYRAAIDRTSPEAPPIDLGRRHLALGRVLIYQGLSHEALPSLESAVSKLEPLADTNPEDFGAALVLQVISDHNADLDKATQSVQRAVTLLEQKAGKKPAYFGARAVLAALQLNSQGEDALAKVASGELLLRNNVKDTEEIFGADHPLTHKHLHNLARHLGKASRQVAAMTEKNESGDKLKNTLLQSRALEAEGYYQRLIRQNEIGHGADHPHVAATSVNYGIVLLNLERHVEAEPLFRRALQISERHFGAKHPQTTRYRMQLAYGLQSAGKSDEAERYFVQVTQEMETFGSWPKEEQRDAALMMAESMSKKKKFDEAITYYEKALKLYPSHAVIERGNIMIMMMNTYFSSSELGKARLTAEQALPLVLLNPEHLQNPDRAIVPMMNLVGVWKIQLRQQMPELKAMFQGMFSKAKVDPELFEKLWKQVSEAK